MKSAAVSPLAQIEWTIGDLSGARKLLESLFRVTTIEREFSAALEGPHMEIVHLGLGQTVLQLCRPLIDATGHWHALEARGPHVYNLTYFVDDLDVVMKRVAAAELPLEWHYPLREIYERVLQPDNLSGSLEAAMVSSSSRIGFNLELAETPWAREPTPRLFYPAFHPDWPSRGELVGPLERINVVTPDLAGALATLTAVFGDAIQVRLSPTHNSYVHVLEAEVSLGSVRIHYLQPGDNSPTDLRVPRCGASVHSLALPAEDLPGIESAAEDLCIPISTCPALLFEPGETTALNARRIATGDILGIDLIVR